MKKLLAVFLIPLMAVFLVVGSANATLLNLSLGYPDIFSNTTGDVYYDADYFEPGSGALFFEATALTITWDGDTLIPITDGNYQAGLSVDSSGNYTGLSYLAIYGTVDGLGSGLLVGGQITAFGYEKVATNLAIFEYAFDVYDGLLLSDYAPFNYQGGDVALWELAGNWDGTFLSDFEGTKVKHDTAPVPEPATMLLLGTGLMGLAGVGRKKFFKK